MIKDVIDEYRRYKITGQKALDQLSDADINRTFGEGNNSAAIVVRHLSGNLLSRFTDFLISDGEKPWRNREAEFDQINYSRAEMNECWARGWDVLEDQLSKLSEEDLDLPVTIRGQELSVRQALLRSLAHTAYHIGQIVLMARICKGESWEWISIPRGKTEEYNQNPILERPPQ